MLLAVNRENPQRENHVISKEPVVEMKIFHSPSSLPIFSYPFFPSDLQHTQYCYSVTQNYYIGIPYSIHPTYHNAKLLMKSNANGQDPESTNTAPEGTPHVLIDGTPFYSDRFYLNTPSGIDNYKEIIETNEWQGTSSVSPTSSWNKQCQQPQQQQRRRQQQQQPHFDRARLVNGLDLVAAVIGTYTFDPEWLSRELPTLFPPLDATAKTSHKMECAVPTLLLHGQKGWRNLIRKNDADLASQKKDESKTSLPTHGRRTQKINKHILHDFGPPKKSPSWIPPPGREIIEIEDDSGSDIANKPLPSLPIPIMSRKRKRKFKREETKGDNFGLKSIHKLAAKHGKKLYQAPESSTMEHDFDTDGEDSDEKYSSTSTFVKCEDVENYIPPEEAWMKNESNSMEGRAETENGGTNQIRLFGGDAIHVTHILPTWFPAEMSRDGTKQRRSGSPCLEANDLLVMIRTCRLLRHIPLHPPLNWMRVHR